MCCAGVSYDETRLNQSPDGGSLGAPRLGSLFVRRKIVGAGVDGG